MMLHVNVEHAGARVLREDRPVDAGTGTGTGASGDVRSRCCTGFDGGIVAAFDIDRTDAIFDASGWAPFVRVTCDVFTRLHCLGLYFVCTNG